MSRHPNDPDGHCYCEECRASGGEGHWTKYITKDNKMAASNPLLDPVFVARVEKERLERKEKIQRGEITLSVITTGTLSGWVPQEDRATNAELKERMLAEVERFITNVRALADEYGCSVFDSDERDAVFQMMTDEIYNRGFS